MLSISCKYGLRVGVACGRTLTVVAGAATCTSVARLRDAHQQREHPLRVQLRAVAKWAQVSLNDWRRTWPKPGGGSGIAREYPRTVYSHRNLTSWRWWLLLDYRSENPASWRNLCALRKKATPAAPQRALLTTTHQNLSLHPYFTLPLLYPYLTLSFPTLPCTLYLIP